MDGMGCNLYTVHSCSVNHFCFGTKESWPKTLELCCLRQLLVEVKLQGQFLLQSLAMFHEIILAKY